MGSDGSKKKFTVIGMASVLLVAAIVGTVVSVKKHNAGEEVAADSTSSGISSSNKAAKALCQHTDYKQSCEESLAEAKDTSDPKELVKVAFKSAVKKVQEAIEKSSTLKETAKDPRAAKALETCKGLLNTSIDDLNRSFDKVGTFDLSQMDSYIADLKVWLSGAVTYQETCLDAFENTTGDSGQQMKKLLKLGGELTSNGLAMIDGITDIVGEMSLASISRRLLDESSAGDYLPYPAKTGHKRLLDLTSQDDYQPYPTWTNGERRSMLDADPATLKPNAVVAKDGSGTFTTIMDAVKTAPMKSTQPFVILIKKGIYREYVNIPRKLNNIVFLGEGPTKTRITGDKNYIDGVNTYETATVAVNGDGFMARDIGFENTAGPTKHQAVALRVSGDMAIFHNCAMDGYQDTLYTHSYRQFYRQCNVTGTIDFVFGDAGAVFQDCKLIVRKPLDNQDCMVTAQGRKDRHSVGGLVLQGCTITAEREFLASSPMPKAYLGRPWKEFSRTIIMQSFIDTNIVSEGWAPWAGTFGLDTCYYSEFENKGPGSNTAQRVTWQGIKKITPQEAETYTPASFIQGDSWIKATGVPYDSGMMRV